MKKMAKKLGAVVLALAMCLSLCCTALVTAADDEFSITITNAQIGQTYTAYKVFDATYNDDGNVAYSIEYDNPWYAYVSVDCVVEGTNDEGQPTEETYPCPFTFTVSNGVSDDGEATTGSVLTVQVATKADGTQYSDTEIINYLNAILSKWTTYDDDGNPTGIDVPESLASTIGASETATEETLKLELTEPGYYFVTSTLGSIVSITTAEPDAYIIEKNNPPGNLEKVITDSTYGSGTHSDSDGDGDDVYFKVTANVPLYAPYDSSYGTTSLEGYLVTDYEFNDYMSAGIDIEGLEENTDYYIEDGHYYATASLINEWITLTDSSGATYKLCTDEANGVTGVAYNVVLELIPTSEDKGEHVSDGEVYFDGFTLTYDTIDMNVYAAVKAENPEGFDTAYELVEAMNAYKEGSAIYPANAEIEIDYQAHMTGLADYENTNNIDMTWHMTTYKGPTPDEPVYEGTDHDDDEIFVWELSILKVDTSDHSKLLEGAVFELSGTNLSSVVISTNEKWTPLEDYAAYQGAKEANTHLFFKLKSGEFTDVDPYTLTDPDELNKYEVNPYSEDPETYPDAAGYTYVAYTYEKTTSQTTTPAADSKVTGTTGENGEITFKGLSQGTYTLTEVEAPDGYNLLPTPITINVVFDPEDPDANEDGFIVTVTAGDENVGFIDYVDGLIEITVENTTGTELPGTGGIGTTIFYIIGGVLVVGAVVVLVTRRRMTTRES